MPARIKERPQTDRISNAIVPITRKIVPSVAANLVLTIGGSKLFPPFLNPVILRYFNRESA
jgi:hypothetical protein